MTDEKNSPIMPSHVTDMIACGFAVWATDEVDENLRAKFDPARIPVAGVRNVRVWGLQVDDERELPGHERTNMPDDEIWEINLEALNGSHYEVDSRMLKAAP